MTDAEIDAITYAQWGEMKGYPLAANRAYARAIESAASKPLLERIAELTSAIDQELCASHLGVFNDGDDPTAAIKKLMQWSQGVGEYFEGEKCKERIAELEAKLAQQAEAQEPCAWIVAGANMTGGVSEYLSWTKTGAGQVKAPLANTPPRPLFTRPQPASKQAHDG